MATPKHLEVLTRSVTEWNAWRTKESFIPDLRYANLRAANLSAADLSDANLRAADLSDANLSDADLRNANLSAANLSDADLRAADLRYADLRYADLSDANLSDANLSAANLRYANLRYANLGAANLSAANLSAADLSDADLRYANLRAANLSDANLSAAKGLQTAQNFMEQFDKDEVGVLVYKAIGNTSFPAPKKWQIEPGAVLTEVVNPERGTLCGCGVNFATLEWVQTNHPESQIWKCRIRWLDLADVVVPFGTDGKARCARLELLEIVTPVKTKTKTTHTKAAA